ncbi:hypothetical protein LTR27_000403 [Elasticomyces elasticus]|nr:hypothetical protein LTR27_000403 [Elasticomyces elasticus]
MFTSILGVRSRIAVFALVFGSFLWTFWYAINSDRDDLPALLTQIIPAGHCACKTSTNFQCASCLDCQSSVIDPSNGEAWDFEYARDGKVESLNEIQCMAAFPGLYEDVERGSKYWLEQSNITSASLDSFGLVHGVTRAIIHNGNLFVVATKSKGEDHRRKMLATLSSIYRALAAAPARSSLPNIEFIFSIEDKADDIAADGHPLWVVARRAVEQSLWLMPDFGLYAWDNIIYDKSNEIGPYDEVVEKALDVELDLPFHQKEPKLVWRGKLSFAPKLRRALLEQSRGHSWGDVKEVNWKVPANYLPMEDHCRYQFIAHAEGRSYSASLKYRQACRSVLVIHKLQYIQHHHYLLIKEGPLQNYVEVERDFSNLPDKMSNLLDHPDKAAKIADQNVKTFRERYLTPAAEACYWRALWRGYAAVSSPAELFEIDLKGVRVKRGLRYETFVLRPSSDMLDFRAS